MLKKAKAFMDDCKELSCYADSDVEKIAIMFICIFLVVFMTIKYAVLIATCPLWLAPYCIYKARKVEDNG